MPRYPLEFGWHTDPESNTSDTPTFTPAMSTLLGGALQRSPAEILFGSTRPADADSGPGESIPVAYHYGDLKCTGGACAGGGDWGTTGAYEIGRRIFCRNCAVKELGLENSSPAEQIHTLERFLKK